MRLPAEVPISFGTQAGNSDFGLKKLAAEPKGEYKAEKETHIPQSPIRTSKSFSVPADEIRANKYDLSISRYKQIEHKEIEYEKPGVIMDRVMGLEREIAKDVEKIKNML